MIINKIHFSSLLQQNTFFIPATTKYMSVEKISLKIHQNNKETRTNNIWILVKTNFIISKKTRIQTRSTKIIYFPFHTNSTSKIESTFHMTSMTSGSFHFQNTTSSLQVPLPLPISKTQIPTDSTKPNLQQQQQHSLHSLT